MVGSTLCTGKPAICLRCVPPSEEVGSAVVTHTTQWCCKYPWAAVIVYHQVIDSKGLYHRKKTSATAFNRYYIRAGTQAGQNIGAVDAEVRPKGKTQVPRKNHHKNHKMAGVHDIFRKRDTEMKTHE